MDKWEATYRNDRSSDRFVAEESASRVVYAVPGSTRVSVQPMTWQVDDTSVAIFNNTIDSEVKMQIYLANDRDLFTLVSRHHFCVLH